MINKLRAPFAKDSNHHADVIINWNPLKRCMLMLLLATGLNILWLVWKSFIIFTPALHIFVDLDLVKLMVWINSFFIMLLSVLIYPCYKLQHHPKAEALLPYFCVACFTLTLLYDGYMIGLMSPATLCGMISVIAVGLVLFSPRLIYSMLIPSIGVIIFLMYGAILGYFPYAPIFDLAAMQYQPYFNAFWLLSMLFFIAPIAISCFVIFDIILHQWREREKTFQRLSQIDPLTLLLNRRSINEYFLSIKTETQAAEHACCIILMDIDYFKKINDNYGHLKGDEVLTEIAQVLKIHTRAEDLVGRYGGEEFIIIINSSDKNLALQIAERCREAIMQLKIYAEGTLIPVTASFGIAYWQSSSHIEHALHQADVAMYQAKQAGRNLVIFSE